jgi:hypothetical protein
MDVEIWEWGFKGEESPPLSENDSMIFTCSFDLGEVGS